jgi:hypothetical protein
MLSGPVSINIFYKNRKKVIFPIYLIAKHAYVFLFLFMYMLIYLISYCAVSCGTVALYGPFFFADHRATVFTLSKTFETAQKKSCAAFLPNFVKKSGARTIKHIYFVSLDIYLHSSIHTYLLIFISSSLS